MSNYIVLLLLSSFIFVAGFQSQYKSLSYNSEGHYYTVSGPLNSCGSIDECATAANTSMIAFENLDCIFEDYDTKPFVADVSTLIPYYFNKTWIYIYDKYGGLGENITECFELACKIYKPYLLVFIDPVP